MAKTLSVPITVEGVGLHTGAEVKVEIHPSTFPCGRIFVRNGVEIPATAEFVTDTRRCTTLGRGGETVSTVEHLLATLFLAGIDHAVIRVDGPELPALDGSAKQWYAAICSAGECLLEAESKTIRIDNPRWMEDVDTQFFLFPSDEFIVHAALSIPDTVAQNMIVGGVVSEPEVCEQIVRARTFGLESEVQALWDRGLAKGGSLDNAVILTQTGYLNEAVWPDEPAWHKVLDLVGDLALLGANIAGRILAVKSGHRSNVELAGYLQKLFVG